MLRFIPALSLAALVAACLGATAPAGPFSATSRVLSVSDPHLTRLGQVEVLGILQLDGSHRWFGGWSGMELDGDMVTMVNDSGHWGRFRLTIDAAGRPMGAEALTIAPLGGLDGSKDDGDAEDLAKVPGGWVVSFERRHRLLRYADLADKPVRLPAPDGIRDLPLNGGIEAVTRLADGRLLALSETGGKAWIDGKPAIYARHEPFNPTAATILPDGSVLVLERSMSWVGGFSIRLVRIDAADIRPGATLAGRELFVLRPPLLVDNYEGLAVRRRADGRLVAYLLSDDNFSPFQDTLLMGVLLPEGAP